MFLPQIAQITQKKALYFNLCNLCNLWPPNFAATQQKNYYLCTVYLLLDQY